MSGNSFCHFRTLQLAEVNTTGAVGERFLAILVAHHTRHFELATCPVCRLFACLGCVATDLKKDIGNQTLILNRQSVTF